MRHVVYHVLENGSRSTRVSMGCDIVLVVPARDVEPGAFVDVDDGQAVWCPKCKAVIEGREADQGLHPDLGVTEEDGDLGPVEIDEFNEQREAEDDAGLGPAEEELPEDPRPTLGR